MDVGYGGEFCLFRIGEVRHGFRDVGRAVSIVNGGSEVLVEPILLGLVVAGFSEFLSKRFTTLAPVFKCTLEEMSSEYGTILLVVYEESRQVS